MLTASWSSPMTTTTLGETRMKSRCGTAYLRPSERRRTNGANPFSSRFLIWSITSSGYSPQWLRARGQMASAIQRFADPVRAPQVKFIALGSTINNVTWITSTNWSLSVTLSNGSNPLTVQGYDRFTNALSGTNASITITREP